MNNTLKIKLVNRITGKVLIERVNWCQSRLCRLRGLQFRRALKPGEAIILVKQADSIANTSIHMFFVIFPIAAVWINSQGVVTHKVLAKPWRPFYVSPAPARYVLETSPEFLDCINVGDELDFI